MPVPALAPVSLRMRRRRAAVPGRPRQDVTLKVDCVAYRTYKPAGRRRQNHDKPVTTRLRLGILATGLAVGLAGGTPAGAATAPAPAPTPCYQHSCDGLDPTLSYLNGTIPKAFCSDGAGDASDLPDGVRVLGGGLLEPRYGGNREEQPLRFLERKGHGALQRPGLEPGACHGRCMGHFDRPMRRIQSGD